jgi:sporulation protein YlmC with PRC-barrel domain
MITNLAIRINGKKGAKLTSVKDFIFDWDAETASGTKVQSIEEMKNVFQQIAASSRIENKNKERLEQRRTHKPASYTK